jgi:hypothetical protein
MEHLSDCSSHHGAECDCGGLDLTAYAPHDFVATRIPSTGRFGFFVGEVGRERFVESKELPALTLAAIASAADLPDTHDSIAILRDPNSVHFNDAREAIIAKFEAKALCKRFAGEI